MLTVGGGGTRVAGIRQRRQRLRHRRGLRRRKVGTSFCCLALPLGEILYENMFNINKGKISRTVYWILEKKCAVNARNKTSVIVL